MEAPWDTTIRSLRQGLIAPFWTNVLAASNLKLVGNVADHPRLNPDAIAAHLVAKPWWLTPFTVAGFRPEEFDFLSPEELTRLTTAVQGIQAITSGWSPNHRATAEERDLARPHFQAVLEVLGFDRYGDVPALIFGKRIEQKLVTMRPSELDHLRFRTGSDSTGDPALWVWAFVAETGEYDEAKFLDRTDVIEDVLKPIARTFAPEGRLYLRFRSTLDQPEVEGVPA